ncbi:MAG: hypothetical protein RL685_1485 [Pseudomonadota bacterium]|jgi:CxxC motif-containing protein (DUF1111 family)
MTSSFPSHRRRVARELLLAASLVLPVLVACSETQVAPALVPGSLVPGSRVTAPPTSPLVTTLTPFAEARAAFEAQPKVSEGLGPLFNEISCSRCHNLGGVGGSGIHATQLAGRSSESGFDPLLEQGGPGFATASVTLDTSSAEQRAIAGCKLSRDGEPLPDVANVYARRRTTALFGLGLVDATPDATFLALAAQQPPALRGRPAPVHSRETDAPALGKFGWKAQAPSLLQFAALALQVELGITNPLFPDEQAPSGNPALAAGCDLVPGLEDDGRIVRRLRDFLLQLEPVASLEPSAEARAGDVLFGELGCAGCHVRSLRSGPHPLAALSQREYWPYSDFLLHDMGANADGIAEGGAAPREMRTAPLWGLNRVSSPRLWHDGRAKTLEAAVLLHDGQAAPSRAAFGALSAEARGQLVAFLATL